MYPNIAVLEHAATKALGESDYYFRLTTNS